MRIAFAVAILLTAAAFLISYGAVISLLGWAAVTSALAWASRRRWRTLAAVWFSMTIGGLLIWPIDAAARFPFLRGLHSLAPFGPEISVFPSPSGRCTAYVYNHSFLDSAYRVRFSHGLLFPGEGHWVPLGSASDAALSCHWEGSKFTADAVGMPLLYEEFDRTVTYPNGKY